MHKTMHQISVETDAQGDIILSQAYSDPNEPDPEIRISPEQAPLVASWIYEAGRASNSDDVVGAQEIPIRFYGRGPEADAENLSVYNNDQGMIIMKVDDDTFIEVSPTMAKRIRDRLSRAIRSALTDLLRPDAET